MDAAGGSTNGGVTLNEAKTSIKQARQESFSFLGYTFGHRYKKDGHWYLGASPSKKAVARIKEKVGNLLIPSKRGDLAGGAGPAESDSEALVGVLQLRNPDSGVWGG